MGRDPIEGAKLETCNSAINGTPPGSQVCDLRRGTVSVSLALKHAHINTHPCAHRGGAGASARTVGAPRQAVLLPARPSRSSSSAPQQQQQQQRQQRPAVLCAAAPGSGPRSGPTGLDVQGMRPTSPGAWEIIRTALIEAGVKLLSPQEGARASKTTAASTQQQRRRWWLAGGRVVVA